MPAMASMKSWLLSAANRKRGSVSSPAARTTSPHPAPEVTEMASSGPRMRFAVAQSRIEACAVELESPT
jgi:hypothetical protein